MLWERCSLLSGQSVLGALLRKGRLMAFLRVGDVAPWVGELVVRLGGSADDCHGAVPFEADGLPVLVWQANPRISSRMLVDPTLLLPCIGTWFDVREWLAVVDGGNHSNLRGEEQVVVLERAREFADLQSPEMLVALRQARDAWARSEGDRALHGPAPAWPTAVDAPGWMQELDYLLIEQGFDSGWTLNAGPEWPIGVVRQRGPLRLQLSVFDNEPLVNVAVWPRRSWTSMPHVANHFGGDADPFDPETMLSLAEQMCDGIFAGHDTVPHEQRYRVEIGHPDSGGKGTGPGGLFEYYLVSGALTDRWFELPDYDQVTTAAYHPDTYQGGPQFQGKLKRGKDLDQIPPVIRDYGSSHSWTEDMLPVLAKVAPDATLFEFNVDGIRFFRSQFARSAGSPAALRERSTGDYRVRPAQGGMVVDPRSAGRPGHLASDGGSPIGDLQAIKTLAEAAPKTELYPTWDPDKTRARITIRKLLTNQPDPEPDPYVIRGPLPADERPASDGIAAQLQGSGHSHHINGVLAGAVEWFASRRDWSGLQTFLDELEDSLIEERHKGLFSNDALDVFTEAAAEMVGKTLEHASVSEDVKAIAIGHYYDGAPTGSLTAYLCFKDEATDLDWPAYFTNDISGPLLHDLLGPWSTLCQQEPEAGHAGYALAYSRIVATLGQLWQDHHRLPIPMAVVDEDLVTYL